MRGFLRKRSKRFKRWLTRYRYLQQGREEILVLGDSHALVFAQPCLQKEFPGHFFTTVSVAGATASGLSNPSSKTRAYEKFNRALQDYRGNRVIVLLGEVDTGYVIWYRAEKYASPVNDMLKLATDTYSGFIAQLQASYQPIVISAPLPTIHDDCMTGEVALARKSVTAGQRQRTLLTLDFNRTIQKFCAERKIHYLNLDQDSLGDSGVVSESLLNDDPRDHHYDYGKYTGLLAPVLHHALQNL